MNSTELARIFDRAAAEQNLSGAVLVEQRGEVLFEQAYGLASRQLNVPNALATKFHIASVTKMFIAMAALVLAEQRLIELQERPAAYLLELTALDREITLHHLLSHTSGLRDVYAVPNLRLEMAKLKAEQGSLRDYLARQPQLFRPGERFCYSSTGFILLGYIMEAVTGMSFDALIKRYVLAPLAMTNTGLDLPRRINPGRAYGHAVVNGELVDAENDRLSTFDAPGELYSTVHDLKRWCDAIFACPLLSPESLKLMFTPYAQVEPGLHYGYGWFLAPRFRGHGGGTPGFVSRIRQYPAQELSVVLLLNSEQTNPDALLGAVDRLLAG